MKRGVARFSPWLVGAILATVALYGWILGATSGLPEISGRQTDYNNLLVHGFLQGHLYLDEPVPPALLAVKNPYDPAQRPFGVGLHDASLYRGRYYIYFGPVPALLVMLPFAAITGNDLPVGYVVGIFVLGTYAALLACYARLREPYVKTGNTLLVDVACLIAVGCCGMQFVLLSRHTMYELAIASGQCFFLWFLSLWLNFPRKCGALAGLCLGLAIASRPIYLFTSVLLFLPLLRSGGLRPFAYAAAACGTVVAALLAYNYARFGQFSEFGQSYQLSGAIEGQVRHFSLINVGFNLQVYFLSALRWGRYFPFVHRIIVPPLPTGFGGYEEAFGLLPNFPFFLLAAAGACVALIRKNQLVVLLLAALILTAALALFFGCDVRYEADFSGPWLLLACGGALALNARLSSGSGSLRGFRALRALFTGLILAAAAFSTAVALLTGMMLYRDFETSSPAQYARLSRWLDTPAAALERWRLLSSPGPRTLQIKLTPGAEGGRREPLLSTGWSPETDRLWAVYPRSGYVRFQWEHGKLGVLAVSPEFALSGSPTHSLAVELGSLYPPPAAAFFARFTPTAIGACRTTLSVALDRQPLWRLTAGFFESSPGMTRYEPAVISAAPGHPAPSAYLLPPAAFSLNLKLSPDWAGRSFPLVTRGRTYGGDILFLRVIDEHTVTLGYDHWGRPPVLSDPIALDLARPHHISIRLPERQSTIAKAVIQCDFDGKPVWHPLVWAYPAEPFELFPTRNLLGASSCEREFPDGAITF